MCSPAIMLLSDARTVVNIAIRTSTIPIDSGKILKRECRDISQKRVEGLESNGRMHLKN
jgi:hypothetical protein